MIVGAPHSSGLDAFLIGQMGSSAISRGGFWDAELPSIRVSHRRVRGSVFPPVADEYVGHWICFYFLPGRVMVRLNVLDYGGIFSMCWWKIAAVRSEMYAREEAAAKAS